jgi:hypothetical protein
MENRVESDEEEDKILALYHEILKQWNKRNAVCMANLFEDNGDLRYDECVLKQVHTRI